MILFCHRPSTSSPSVLDVNVTMADDNSDNPQPSTSSQSQPQVTAASHDKSQRQVTSQVTPPSIRDAFQNISAYKGKLVNILHKANNELINRTNINTRCFGYFLVGGSKHSAITLSILYFICKDMRPFNIVQGDGFKHLMKEIAPNYKVPSASFLKKKLNDKFSVCVDYAKQKIKCSPHISATVDIWTETMNEKSYLGVTVHYFEDTQYVHYNIATRELKSNHTRDYLVDVMGGIFNEWEINLPQIRAIVSDNGANIVSAIKTLIGEKNQLPCFAHTINLVVSEALAIESVEKTVKKIRTIVKWIKNSVNNSDKLRKFQIDNGVAEGNVKKLILDVSTRWNSTFYMLERYLEMSAVCTQILLSTSDTRSPDITDMPSALDLNIVRQMVTVLKPLEYVTKDISGENYVTVSKIIPMVNCLHKKMESIVPESDVIGALKQSILNSIKKRFGQTEFNSHIAVACLLDPRFKNLHFRDASACGKAIHKLKELISCETNKSSESSEDDTTSQQMEFDFWLPHKELVHGRGKERKTQIQLDEVSLYLQNPVCPLNSDILVQWEEMKSIFSLLYKQARGFLLVAGSSVPCERLFSKAGLTMTETRNRLSSKHLEQLLFLGSLSEEEFFL